jgi:GNAT superfamily N-acetyltransferase
MEMNFLIEPVTSVPGKASASYVREQVFERECGIRLPPLPAREAMLTLIARSEWDPDPAAVLTVLETTGDEELHRSLGLIFDKETRVARYTQFAVLKPYRGQHLASRLVLEAHRQFVAPRGIDYSWLLFGARQANSSSFCRQLGFIASPETFFTEYGRCRVLTRNERSAGAELTHWRSAQPAAASPNVNVHLAE